MAQTTKSKPKAGKKSIAEIIQELKAELSKVRVQLGKNYKYMQPEYDGEAYTEAFVAARKKGHKELEIEDFQTEPARPELAQAARMLWFSHLDSIATLNEQLIYRVSLFGKGNTKTVVSRLRFAFKRLLKSLESVEDEPTKLVTAQEEADKYLECLDTTLQYFTELGDSDISKPKRPQVKKAVEVLLEQKPQLADDDRDQFVELVNEKLKFWGQQPIANKTNVKNALHVLRKEQAEAKKSRK